LLLVHKIHATYHWTTTRFLFFSMDQPRPRIVLIAPNAPPDQRSAVETFMLEILRECQDAGIEVLVLAGVQAGPIGCPGLPRRPPHCSEPRLFVCGSSHRSFDVGSTTAKRLSAP